MKHKIYLLLLILLSACTPVVAQVPSPTPTDCGCSIFGPGSATATGGIVLEEQGPEITPSPIDIASFRNRWSTYENETYGFSFLYPSVYEGGNYGFCKVREQTGNTTQEESVFVLNLGSRIQLTLKKTGENILEDVVDAYRSSSERKDAQFEEAQERMVAGLPALTLPYRMGGTNRYAEVTFWIKDGTLYQVEAGTPSACDVEAIGLRELNAYQKLLESFRY